MCVCAFDDECSETSEGKENYDDLSKEDLVAKLKEAEAKLEKLEDSTSERSAKP